MSPPQGSEDDAVAAFQSQMARHDRVQAWLVGVVILCALVIIWLWAYALMVIPL